MSEELETAMHPEERHKARMLRCQALRRYMASHPGLTREELYRATGLSEGLSFLERQRLAERRMSDKGTIGWYVVPMGEAPLPALTRRLVERED